MKVPLRELFQRQQVYTSNTDPVIRLGALYRLAQRNDDAYVTAELTRVLASLEGCLSQSADDDNLVFGLHASVLLAQRNVFDGVNWILDHVTSPTLGVRALAETALRNCTQFPLAVIMAQTFDLSASTARDRVSNLMMRSEDDLFAVAQQPEPEQQAALTTLTDDLTHLTSLPYRAGRHLGLGIVMTRAELRDRGYRYTGFIGLDRADQPPLILPYELPDILNRPDRHAQNRVLRNLGWVTYRTLVVYTTDEQLEALALYVLPFAPLTSTELEAAIARLAAPAHGAQIAVVMQVQQQPGGGGGYRLLTTSGQALWQKHRVDQQQIGDCFLLHERNDWPLWTRHRVNPEARGHVLEQFFNSTPSAFGVTLEMVERQDGLNVRVVRAIDGEERLRRVSQPVAPGTLVYWAASEDGKLFPSLIPDQRIEGGCPQCFGARYHLCDECAGEAHVTCPACQGSQRVTCPECDGSSKTSCGHCDGTGQRRVVCNGCNGAGHWTSDCSNCSGTGIYSGSCRVCNGTGRYADSGRLCKACGGAGRFSSQCRRCQGQGKVTRECRYCNGTGERTVTCRTCNGTGAWNCRACRGTGQVRCGCEYGRIICPTCDGCRVTPCVCDGLQRGRIVPTVVAVETL